MVPSHLVLVYDIIRYAVFSRAVCFYFQTLMNVVQTTRVAITASTMKAVTAVSVLMDISSQTTRLRAKYLAAVSLTNLVIEPDLMFTSKRREEGLFLPFLYV